MHISTKVATLVKCMPCTCTCTCNYCECTYFVYPKVPHSSKLVSKEDVFGIKPKPLPRQAPPKSLKVSIQCHLVASLRPEPKPTVQAPPLSPPTATVSRFLTKAEKKADIASHHHRHERERHGPAMGTAGGGGGGGGLVVTPGETKSVTALLPTAVLHTPSASPSPTPEDERLVRLAGHHLYTQCTCVTHAVQM